MAIKLTIKPAEGAQSPLLIVVGGGWFGAPTAMFSAPRAGDGPTRRRPGPMATSGDEEGGDGQVCGRIVGRGAEGHGAEAHGRIEWRSQVSGARWSISSGR